MRKRHKNFLDLSRNKRADMWFDIKHRIAKGPYSNFHTIDYLMDGVSWADVYFLSPDKGIFWNATLVTASNEFADIAHNKASDVAYDGLSEEERKKEFKIEFEPVPDRKGFSRMVIPEKVKYDQFDGRTYYEQLSWLESQFMNDPIEVYEQITFHYDYAFGIGLHAILDVEILNATVITDFVNRFDGKEFKSPIPCQHVKCPTYMSNSLII